jgi:endonuclease YncB( thermonuclease family)
MSLPKLFGSLRLGTFLATLLSFTLVGLAGDAFDGTVTSVKRTDLVTFDYGGTTYDVRIAGIDTPEDPEVAAEAVRLVSRLLLNKNCQLRFEGYTPDGEIVGRLVADDPDIGIKDVGVELVRSGLAHPQPDYQGYKYGEMNKAESEAKDTNRGIWKTPHK